MPITIQIATHPATIIPIDQDDPPLTPLQIVNHLLEDTGSDDKPLPSSRLPPILCHIQSSSHNSKSPTPPVVQPSTNGFIHTITHAYNNHHHVTIRPDDIWLSIITQFSFFVNAHAESLRGKFVSHKGKVFLNVDYASGSRFTVSMCDFTAKMAGLIEQNIVDPGLRMWVLPKFTTTTDDDTIAMSIVMMGSLKKYFEYGMTIMCGIPSVTLLGEKGDYEDILARVGKLTEYGEEPAQFRAGLVPVLEGITRTFDDPQGKEVKRFWETICDYEGGSGVSYYSGIDYNGEEIDGELLAGSVAIECSSSGKLSLAYESYDGEMQVGLDSMQPRIGWVLYERQEAFGPVYEGGCFGEVEGEERGHGWR